MTCQDCRYWVRLKPTPDGKDSSMGDCRYRPPVLHLECDQLASGWPWTQQDAWCGRWREKIEVEETTS